ncbi:MAG: TrmH family RNA methyltransferase, partial [Planctomycetota bacterium]|nr:TrmH family RNA methyltransferase [Planctomycetota bacterium]
MTHSFPGPLLIGDCIENPWNRAALNDLAELFQWQAAFCSPAQFEQENDAKTRPFVADDELNHYDFEDIQAAVETLFCFDTGNQAQSIYGMKQTKLSDVALVVGNERKGIRRDVLDAATKLIQVPMASRRVNSLNVAAAAAVALYYLSKGSAPIFTRSDPEKHRPNLLFLAGDDHIELGSTLRSAAAFGWSQVLLEDPQKIWFESDRARQLESRAAARRSKNKIRIVPSTKTQQHYYDEAVLVRGEPGSPTLNQSDLARGSRQLIILADEAAV